ncbi:MAG: O-antigen ligase family protein [Bacteroidia bacterium]|nr:O-antigen ligase family protein [Bacteroidia bacterium]
MEKLRQQLLFVSGIILLAGLFLMDVVRILPSLGMAFVFLLGISYYIKPKQSENDSPNMLFWMLTLCFFALLPSYFYSDNKDYFAQKIQVAIPFLLLPIAFGKLPKLSTLKYHQFLTFFVWGTFSISLFAIGNYIIYFDTINQLYLESKVMPTLVTHHPTFSIIVVFACYLCYYLYQKNEEFLFVGEKKILLIMGIFLFIFVHIFSVRSGILSLYVLLGIELIKLIFQKKQIKTAILVGSVLLLIGTLTMYFSPTVSNKIANTSKDLQTMQSEGSANNQSLSSRFISYKNALEITQNSSWLWGCGLGDMEDLNNEIFRTKYPDVSKPIIPHNQFLFFLASIGIIGLSIFLIGFYSPFFICKNYQNPVLFSHLILTGIYFLVESPLLTQIGVAYVLVFLLFGLNQTQKSAD